MSHSSRITNHGTGHRVCEITFGGALCTQGTDPIQNICSIFCILDYIFISHNYRNKINSVDHD